MSTERRHRPSLHGGPALALRCPRCGLEDEGRPGTRCPIDETAMCVAAEVPAKGDPLLGRVLVARYPVVGVLGRGGMGAVYRGVQEPLGRFVALKVIRPEAASAGDESSPLRRRFFREAQAIAALSHPGIVGLYDYGETDDGLLFMVMELIEGPSLRTVLKQAGRLPVDRAVALVTQVLDALGHAHAQGIVHRDLKPGNVMLLGAGTPTERAKLLDFGVAKVFAQDPGLSDITQGGSGTTLGTPRYMAPEQILNADISPRTDLYAAGILLYALLVGRPPFDGPSGFHIQRLHQEAPVPALDPALGVPAGVEKALRWALEKRPEDRPGSAGTLSDALRTGLSGDASTLLLDTGPLPVVAGPDVTTPDTVAPEPLDETSGHGETSVAPTAPEGAGPPRMVLYGGLVVAAAALGFLAMHLLRADEPAPSGVRPAPATAPPRVEVRMGADVGVPSAAAAPAPVSGTVGPASAPSAPVTPAPVSGTAAPATRPARAPQPSPARSPRSGASPAPAVKVERL